MPPIAHSHRLRQGRHSRAGQAYLLTFVTEGREPVFTDLVAARCVVQVLRQEHRLSRALTLAFVVMPDHVHWLMQLGTVVTLPQCVQGVKSMVSRRLGRPVWQAGFHDRAMRRQEDLRGIARYVVANPIRAGLAHELGGYAHWDACWVRGEEVL